MSEVSNQAYSIITSQKFDYFESESEAREHLELEGFQPYHAFKTTLGYTGVPRQYLHCFNLRLRDAFDALESPEAQDFLHIDRYAVTLGRTNGGRGHSSGTDLVIASHGRSCSLRLHSADTTSFRLQSQQQDEPLQTHRHEPCELPLGRNVVLPGSWPDEYSRAVRNSFRDWERVLIVGQDAIKQYIRTSFFEKREGITNDQYAARIGQVGYLLTLEKELGYDTDFRAVTADPESV